MSNIICNDLKDAINVHKALYNIIQWTWMCFVTYFSINEDSWGNFKQFYKRTNFFVLSTTFLTNSSWIEASTNSRPAAMQFSPLLKKTPFLPCNRTWGYILSAANVDLEGRYGGMVQCFIVHRSVHITSCTDASFVGKMKSVYTSVQTESSNKVVCASSLRG
jgi:hypothetical protein